MKMPATSSSVIKYLKYSVASLILLVIFQIPHTEGHGRLIEPPSRASAWRYGFNTPPNYNDHELFCGGFTKQHQSNGRKKLIKITQKN